MDDRHRRFLQTLMRIGIVDEANAKQLLHHCCSTQNNQLDDFIDTINTTLEPMFMQIRKGMCEESGVQHYALVNMIETDATTMTTDYAVHELEIFRKVMDLIVDSETGRVYSTEILNCAKSLTKKTKKRDTEELLNRLVQDNWLIEKNGEYCLSTRCIIEMEQYIRTMYQDQVKVCRICRNIAFQVHSKKHHLTKVFKADLDGVVSNKVDKFFLLKFQSQICENPTCGINIHNPCVARFFRGATEPRCPACNDVWPHRIPDFEARRSQSSK
ncbi:non-structural maintenance of chromosomes element 1 homolog isoform X1 [Syngnathus typhle]|uniref:non-structural maintenance of chromosomes element 1 homolog isoform X1 n=1 Tax=Syngnathus typhle TaxID=161592 RepID=UPI002A69C6B4|nr:non-structural maintenance of chromosomes element 1 homolog isoform X1 [Syngnathus typhle]